ncbi:hypothetical protein K3175_06430 [Qipengyuania sp. GH1]|uniref:hypothetical protein n=1 Tax=Qipengyuania aestuarii TaxID=2867241 RepID=UPI001C87F8BC|nr:hypothetical protein [Qipengyuania aestuarii]MBX7535292.1 hypothetical protein [Qipengyuania aestuarii]
MKSSAITRLKACGRGFAAIGLLISLTATWVPPTTETLQAHADRLIEKCKAENLIEVVVESPQVMKIKVLKDPEERTDAETSALQCLSRQTMGHVDFRPAADLLLTAQKTN